MIGEARLALSALAAGVLAVPLAAAAGGIAAGGSGAASAAIGAGLPAVNLAVGAALMTIGARRYPALGLLIVLPSSVVRVAAIMVGFGALQGAAFIDGRVFALTFAVSLVGILTLEVALWRRIPWPLSIRPSRAAPARPELAAAAARTTGMGERA